MQGLKHLEGKPGKLENSGKVEKYIEKTGKNKEIPWKIKALRESLENLYTFQLIET